MALFTRPPVHIPHNRKVLLNVRTGIFWKLYEHLYSVLICLRYWGEAFTSTAYLINRVPSSSLNFQTPFQVLQQAIQSPTIPNLPPRVFGSVVFVHLPTHLRHKLEPRALRCVFVGYGVHQKGYRCYHLPTNKIYVSHDVRFHEDEMYYSLPESTFQGETRHEDTHNQREILDFDIVNAGVAPSGEVAPSGDMHELHGTDMHTTSGELHGTNT